MKIFNRYPDDLAEKLALKIKQKARKSRHFFLHKSHLFQSHTNKTKVLCVLDRSCNIRYLTEMLSYMKAWGWIEYKIVDLVQFLNEEEHLYDALIYQTWSCEIDYAPLSDQKFIASSLPKILFDAHASGSFDTYYRFQNPKIPRIKNACADNFLKEFNVICKTSHPVDVLKRKTKPREIDISYCVGLQTHEVRPKVYEKVMPYQKKWKVDLKNNRHNYVSYLRRVRISINVPGYGEGTFRHLYTLNAGSLLLAHDSIEPIHLLPFARLKSDRDYILFNLENFDEKLQWCLDHPKEIEEIAATGRETFYKGYDIKRSAKEFMPELQKVIDSESSLFLNLS